MTNGYLETLLVECAEALLSLSVKQTAPHGKAYKTYLKVKHQLENRCATCGVLMDARNCCMVDIKENKMYHVGCAPKRYNRSKKLASPLKACRKETEQEKILGLIEKSKEMDESAKMDLVLEVIWGMMSKER